MRAIFYDLETSDAEPIAQILNYSFIAVDEAFSPIAECSGEIQLSRLQLPSPEAILKNRVDVRAHRARPLPSEHEAMRGIAGFVQRMIDESKAPVAMIGFNSNKFDLPRVRTSFIRNGMNPYFGGKIQYRDLLSSVRALYVRNPEFPRPERLNEEGVPTLSLSLEEVTRALGILEKPQSHHSREDVLLTIALAKVLKERFSLDVRHAPGFEVAELLSTPRWRAEAGLCLWRLQPQYEDGHEARACRTPFVVLDADHRSCLMVDLEHYAEGEGSSSIRWFNFSTGEFLFGGEGAPGELLHAGEGQFRLGDLAASARREFAPINLKNYFDKSTCDIEQDIYRIDFQGIEALAKLIREGGSLPRDKSPHKTENPNGNPRRERSPLDDIRVLLVRYRLRESKTLDAEGQRILASYGRYRYGGTMRLTKHETFDEEGRPEPRYHPSLKDLFQKINERLKGVEASTDPRMVEDRRLLESLKSYYLSSELVQLIGEELR